MKNYMLFKGQKILFGSCFILFLSISAASKCFSQDTYELNKKSITKINALNKDVIDANSVDHWYRLGGETPLISSKGKFVAYTLFNLPSGESTLIIQSLQSNYKNELIGAVPITFSNDERLFVFVKKDSLGLVGFEDSKCNFISSVKSWKQPKNSIGKWIAYHINNERRELVLLDLISGLAQHYQNVSKYIFSNNGNSILIESSERQGDNIKDTLSVIQLSTLQKSTIWEENRKSKGSLVTSSSFDESGTQIIFSTTNGNNSQDNTIWYYKDGMRKATIKIDKDSLGSNNQFSIGSSARFISQGRFIATNLIPQIKFQPATSYVKLDIWGYRDTVLKSDELIGNESNLISESYLAVKAVSGNGVVALKQNVGDNLIMSLKEPTDFAILFNNTKGDRFWLKQKDSIWLLSLKNGNKTVLKTIGRAEAKFSSDGRYLVYYDSGSQNSYFSYDLVTGKLNNISKGTPKDIFASHQEYYYSSANPSTKRILNSNVGIAGWLGRDTAMLVYDDFDIWQLDLTAKKKPINITNGFGRRHGIRLRIASGSQEPVIIRDTFLLISGYNIHTKENGFYTQPLGGKKSLECCYMGPHLFFHSPFSNDGSNAFDQGMEPIKARNSQVWLVKRQSATEAPNYFITTDFKSFNKVSNIQPQAEFNWLTTQLISWMSPEGIKADGVLYKPENFDPNKKYPVIFVIYEQLSHRLYQYTHAGYTEEFINIPWFVSHGYLVFTPDIHFTAGKLGASAYSSVVSAIRRLSKFPFVDVNRIAIQGHSYSGLMVNYIIAHTNQFAAAITGGGHSDMISSYLQLAGTSCRKEGQCMNGYELTMGGSLWEHPELYIKESPVLRADKINTPLIIFHSINDRVPWEQAVEMYLSLRRLEKRSWMLQYEDGPHGVAGKDAIDYTIRVNQFFDHYLKHSPAPIWMTRGIQARLKGIETGYAYDPSGNCGKDCKVCKYWNEKMKKDSVACWKEIEEKTKSEHWMGVADKCICTFSVLQDQEVLF